LLGRGLGAGQKLSEWPGGYKKSHRGAKEGLAL
jgi:hypothetical protein